MTIVSFDIFNSVIGDSTKASTMPMNRRSVPSLTPRALSQYEGMGEPGHSKSLPSCISTTGLRPSLVGAFWCLIFFFYGWLFLFLGRNTTSLLLNVTYSACDMIVYTPPEDNAYSMIHLNTYILVFWLIWKIYPSHVLKGAWLGILLLWNKAYYCAFVKVSTPSEGNAVMKALQEANMSTEVGLVVLDILALYTQTFKVSFSSHYGKN